MSSNVKPPGASIGGQIYTLRRDLQTYYILLLLGIIPLGIDHMGPFICDDVC
jgi:hypothetical protein